MLIKKLYTSLIFALLAFAAIPLSAQQSTSYLVSWAPNPEPDIASYIIYRSTDAGDTNPSAIDTISASTLSYLDESVLKGVSYYYWLKAINTTGLSSPLSNGVSGFTVPQDANETVQNLCHITQMLKTGGTSYEIDWSTVAQTIGFVQYDRDALLDSMSAWDNDAYTTSHASMLEDLVSSSTYYLRAVSYDASDNMVVSATDTMVVSYEPPQPLATPHISIYPVPYRPLEGALNLVDLPEGGSIVILGSDGLEVWSTAIGTETSMAWNGTNNQGSPVMSGVYFAIVRNASGDAVEKRPIMIVR